jgi:hypothetical protein
MTSLKIRPRLGAALALGHALVAQASSDASCDTSRSKTAPQARITFAHALARLDGGHLEVTLVEVPLRSWRVLPASESPCPVIGYVIEGTLLTRVKGQPAALYNASGSF